MYTSEGIADVVFKIGYNGALLELEQEYLLLRYAPDRGIVDVLGYFIEGTNVLTLFKPTIS